MLWLKRLSFGLIFTGVTWGLGSCRVIAPQPTLDADVYRLVHTKQPDLEKQKLYITDLGDSLQVIVPANDERRFIPRSTYQSWTFKRSAADVDVFTLPFKIRPAQGMLPGQLNSNFNAAIYLGRRIDLYNYRWKSITPSFGVRELRSRGFGYGVFAGLGSVAINDFVVRLPIGIEYEGVVLDAGVAAIYDARIFNIGLAVGLDYLTDRNRTQWIYQQKPWFGVLFGLNLN
jgi:hypothetical protein